MKLQNLLAVLAAGVASLTLATHPAAAFGTVTYPVPVTNSVVFFNGGLGGQNDLTLTGTPYAYNPADGNLVIEVIASNQADICNGCGNGFMEADYTGSQVVRAVAVTNGGTFTGTGALVTTFNGAVTLGSFDSGNCYPFDCNDSGSSTGQSFNYFEVYNAAAFAGPISISSITFPQDSAIPGTVLSGDYEVILGVQSGVPEPATWTMLLLGIGGLGASLRVARRKSGAVFTA